VFRSKVHSVQLIQHLHETVIWCSHQFVPTVRDFDPFPIHRSWEGTKSRLFFFVISWCAHTEYHSQTQSDLWRVDVYKCGQILSSCAVTDVTSASMFLHYLSCISVDIWFMCQSSIKPDVLRVPLNFISPVIISVWRLFVHSFTECTCHFEICR